MLAANCGWVWINHVKAVNSWLEGVTALWWGECLLLSSPCNRVTVVVALHKSILSFSFSQLKTHPHVRSLETCKLPTIMMRLCHQRQLSQSCWSKELLQSQRFRDRYWPNSCSISKFIQTTNCHGDKDPSKFHDNFTTQNHSRQRMEGLHQERHQDLGGPHNIWFVTFDVNI